MKKIILLITIGITIFSCENGKKDNQFLINGSLAGLSKGKVYFQKIVDGKLRSVDSTEIQLDTLTKAGTFQFKGSLILPEFCLIKYTDKGISLFVENQNINIKGNIDSLDKITITGSKINDNYKAFIDSRRPFEDQGEIIGNKMKLAKDAKDMITMKKLDKSSDSLDNVEKEYMLKYVKENSNTVLAPFITYKFLAYQIDLKQLQDLVGGFDTAIKKSVYIDYLKERIDILKKVQVGQPAPDFTQNDTTGKPISLSSFKGKYVLIDFWASWCGPCRRENPNNIELYKKFNKKGFEILGVSLDKTKEKWEKAIKDDKLVWAQVSDLNYWDNEVAKKLYGIRSIPNTVLIDKEGIIVANGLQGDALKTKLVEILGN
jgi:peroxiredoxin